MPEDDAALARRAGTGDAAAFGELMERHERRVYNLALRMTGNPEDAGDATQEAFLTAFRKISSFRGEAAFTTWLHRVAVNASYDVLRKRARAPVPTGDDEARPEPGPPTPDHADEVAGSLDAARALTFVQEEFRAPLVMHDVQDLPYEEISAILEVPLGTVKSRIHRGRVALARAMAAGAGEPAGAHRPSKERP